MSHWLHASLFTPLILFIFFIFHSLRKTLPFNFQKSFRLSPLIKNYWFIAAIFLILLLSLSTGVGNFWYQNWDYTKHNGIYFDLIQSKWPAIVQLNHQDYYLVYYLAHYLLPALCGKIWTIGAMEIAAQFQLFVGLFIIFGILKNITKTKYFFPLVLSFIFWGGLDCIGRFSVQGDMNNFGELGEWWAGATTFQYTGFYDLLVWVPQHALAGWMSLLLVLISLEKKIYRLIPFILAITLLWSPFAILGLIPFIFILFINLVIEKKLLGFVLSFEFLFSIIMLVLMGLYYSSINYTQPINWQYLRLIPEEFFKRYPLFLFLEFLLISILIYPHRYLWPQTLKLCFFPVLLYLIFIPNVYFGAYSDYSMRASVPCLLYVFILYFFTVTHPLVSRRKKIILYFYALVASYSAISDIYRGFHLLEQKIPYTSVTRFDPDNLSKQYIGNKESFFFKYITPKN